MSSSSTMRVARALSRQMQRTPASASWRTASRGGVLQRLRVQRALGPSARSFQTTVMVSMEAKDGDKSHASKFPAVVDGEDDEEGAEEAEDDLEEYEDDDEDDEFDENDEELEEDDDEEEAEEAVAGAEEGRAMAAEYMGVQYNPRNIKKYSAELEIDGYTISGGDYWTALDAAKGYDELVALYCDLDTPRNFPAGSEAAEAAAAAMPDIAAMFGAAGSSSSSSSAATTEWEIPEVGKRHADIIPPIKGAYLTLEEVLPALEREKAIDVYTVNLSGKSSLADYMIFTTGRSQAHMRRMADMMIQSMKAREIVDDFDYAVEGRDCDDWMIADCNNIVVHFMREDTRRILKLEDHWENMENDKHKIYGDMDEDEYMDKFGTSELMEYLEDDDFISAEDAASVDDKGVEWK